MNTLQISWQLLEKPYIGIAARSLAVYLFLILAIRIFGKKELAQLSVIDRAEPSKTYMAGKLGVHGSASSTHQKKLKILLSWYYFIYI